jgi:hypothetical protein
VALIETANWSRLADAVPYDIMASVARGLDCPQHLLFYSSTTKMAAVSTSTVQANAREEFPITQFKDELVFKGGRDIMCLIQCEQTNTKGPRQPHPSAVTDKD